MYQKICKTCKKDFETPYKIRKFCSRKCYEISQTNFNEYIIENDITKIIIHSPKNGNKIILIDTEDIEKCKKYNWFLRPDYTSNFERFYIETFNGENYKTRKIIKLHRYITNCPDNMVVDHINRNTLDNRKCNLRICTQMENMQNRKMQRDNKLKEKNISFDKSKNKYIFQICRNFKIFRQEFNTLEEAIIFRNSYKKERDLI